MKVLHLFFGVAIGLTPALARATTIYDSVNLTNTADFNSGSDVTYSSWDRIDPTSNGPNASQFAVGYSQILSSVSLVLSASTPTDGGSLSVVLMSDNGGWPPISSVSDPYATYGTLTTFTNYTVLGTIADSSLSQTSSLVTIPTSVSLAAGTYWIGTMTSPLPTSSTDPATEVFGSGQWWWTNPDASVPATYNFNSIGATAPFAAGGTSPYGAYELIVTSNTSVSAPEPTTLAIFSCGIAGLGFVRWRKARRCDRHSLFEHGAVLEQLI